jgi:2-oxoglutarate dehydrogenase E1 component
VKRQEHDQSANERKMAGESGAGEWRDFMSRPTPSDSVTAVELPELKAALSIISKVPEGFALHPATSRAILRRAELLDKLKDHENCQVELHVDWATAELLALATLAQEGHFCRLSGQDSQRGTFSQRHAVWHDTVTGEVHYSLPDLVHVVDSPLSELGVLGFEHGFSLASPNFLVLWEAQFADFADNSQVLIDTMITSEKEKFGLESNLVLLLPHGYDGMGPEHSSARLERFLTLHTDTPKLSEQTVDDLERFRASNFTVIYPSTPSNYFHLLRRSFAWPFRRPMIILTPKRTLRMTQATSQLTEFMRSQGSQSAFEVVLDDPRIIERGRIESIVLCSGEVFYDAMKLLLELSEEPTQTTAILRVEQLAPFPLRQLRATAEQYPHVQRAVWVQEEPQNMGALRFVTPFLQRALPQNVQLCEPISRPVSAAPAIGNPRDHQSSQNELLSKLSTWIVRSG